MNKLLGCLSALLLSTGGALAQTEATPITNGEQFVLDSAIMGEARTLNVWLPPDVDTAEEPYTVLYLIDGGLQQDYPHIAGLAQLGVLSWQFKPLIVVGIETKNRQNELTAPAEVARYRETFPATGGGERFRRHIAEEVIPFIETQYRTGERRAVIGESLAGLFIVDTFLNATEMFDDYIAVSPSLWWDDQATGHQAAAALNSTDNTGQRLYLTMADEGGTMQAGLDRVMAALEADPTPPEWHYVDRSATETHSTIYHGAALDALRLLYAHPPYDYGDNPWYLTLDETD